MALSLKFRIELSSDGVTLTIIDRTGAYSGLNTGGFGSPNPAITDALTATIKIAKRNADGTWGTETSVNVFDDTVPLPSNSGGETTITATQAAQGAAYSDGIYRIIYTVTGSVATVPFSATVTRYDTLRNSILSCYQVKAAAVAICGCGCDEITNEFNCFSLYLSLLCREEGGGAECAGDLNQIQSYIDKLAEMCEDTAC